MSIFKFLEVFLRLQADLVKNQFLFLHLQLHCIYHQQFLEDYQQAFDLQWFVVYLLYLEVSYLCPQHLNRWQEVHFLVRHIQLLNQVQCRQVYLKYQDIPDNHL